MKNAPSIPVKVRFTFKNYAEFRGVINRHNRRKYLKLSRVSRLMSDMVPINFLAYTQQGIFKGA